MKENRSPARALCRGALIAAMYVALTVLAAQLGLSSGVIQLRLSEALCVMPLFTAAAVPGLAVGCFLANALTGAVALDVVMGAAATLIGALGTYALRRRPLPALLPPILANTVIVPWVLRYGYGVPDAIWYMMLTVGAGEVLSVGVLGFLLYLSLRRRAGQLLGGEAE